MSDNTKLTASQQVLYSSVRVQGMLSNYYDHTYQILLLGSPAQNNFHVILNTRIKYKWSNHYTADWSIDETYTTLAEAQARFKHIMEHPFEVMTQQAPASASYWSGQISTKNNRKDYKTLKEYNRPDNFDPAKVARKILEGKESLPLNYHGTEVVPLLWQQPTNKHSRDELLKFIRAEDSILYGHWGAWKWLYKQAEQANDAQLLAAFLVRLDNLAFFKGQGNPIDLNNPDWFGRGPSRQTIEYMKRRGRRYLRKLAKTEPQKYIQLAIEVVQTSVKTDQGFNLSYNWISLDILFGRSGRFIQKGHGRGAYSVGKKRIPVSYQDPHNDLWAAHPDVLQNLYRKDKHPWEVVEWALLLLRHNKLAVPELNHDRAERFLQSPSPLLVREAMRKVMSEPSAISKYSGIAAANAFWYANATQRPALTKPLSAITKKERQDFARALFNKVNSVAAKYRYGRRSLDAIILLVQSYLEIFQDWQMRQFLPYLTLMLPKQPEIMGLLEKIINKQRPTDIAWFIQDIAGMPEPAREQLLQMLLKKATGQALSYWYYQNLITNTTSEWIRLAGWRLYDIQTTKDDAYILNLVLQSSNLEVLTTALTSPVGFKLFLSNADKLQALKDRISSDSQILNRLDWKAINVLLKAFPADFALLIVGGMSEERWNELRENLLNELKLDARLGAFWKTAWENALTLQNVPHLLPRLLNDSALKAAFFENVSLDYFKGVSPEFVPLLLEWLERSPEVFKQGSQELLFAAMSKIPEIRNAGLARITQVGQTLPFALRLVESGLPETIAKGKEFFEALPAGDTREMDYALAICDSPDKTAQLFGREFMQKRWATLPTAELLRRLSEHPDPLIQELLATQLLQTPEVQTEVPTGDFDRTVLRRRNKGRKVKELVKERLEQNPAGFDKATLLEMARSRTPRDAEWALQQLVRLAQAGEAIDGLTIDGVNGI